jgi:hypothetical protein
LRKSPLACAAIRWASVASSTNPELLQADTDDGSTIRKPFALPRHGGGRSTQPLLSSHHSRTDARKRHPSSDLPGARRCLFREDELLAWVDGTDLEVLELPDGGRVVRPVPSAYAE